VQAAVAKEQGAQGTTISNVSTKKETPIDPNQPPSERFFSELQKTTQLTFGKEGTPQLIMIMDVNCSHCKNTWKALQPMVENGSIRVTMVPIQAINVQSSIDTANWLNSRDPYDTWKKYLAGDDKIMKVGNPDPDKEALIFKNTELIKKWGVTQTPYILYRGNNGKIRVVEGEPQNIAALRADILEK
jgi:protein-disulfide isomerase